MAFRSAEKAHFNFLSLGFSYSLRSFDLRSLGAGSFLHQESS